MISVRWLGHATFEVECAGARFLIDPWMTGNPSSPPDLNSPKRYASEWKPTAILVTHAHNDHSADAVAISNASGAPVVSEYGWIGTLGLPEGKAMGGNVGGKFKFGSATVHLVPAIHSSPPGGRPMGFVIDFTGGDVVYHTGDTWIFGDMALIHEIYKPSVILLNTGGGPYTQDPQTAALAVKKYFSPRAIIPFHWGTFPALANEAEIRDAFTGDHRLQILKPGERRDV